MSDDDGLGVEYEKLIEEDNIEFVREYFPEKNNIKQKGRLESNLPVILSTVEMFPDMFPELRGFEEMIYNWIDSIEQRKISVSGKSRKEFENILSSFVAYANRQEDDRRPSSEGYKDLFKSRSKK